LLRARPRPVADPRPALLAVIALLVLLVPFVLLTSSPVHLAALGLALAAEAPAAPRSGAVRDVVVLLRGDEIEIRALVRRTDVTASDRDVEERVTRLPPTATGPDLTGLGDVLDGLRRLDPDRRRLRLAPEDGVPAGRVVAAMDVARGGPDAPRFADVVLEVVR
jgi:hypothetical protein